jgi:VWFA-related protein
VLVPVVVKRGKERVSGLSKDDFVVLEDNVPQPIAFVNAARSSGVYQKSGDGSVFTNELQSSSEPPRLTVIAVDGMNTPFIDQAWVVQQVKAFLGTAPTQPQPTAIIGFTFTGTRIIHDFSTDTASLVEAFDLASGKKPSQVGESTPGAKTTKPVRVLGVISQSDPPMADNPAICVEKLTRTLEGLLVLAQSVSGIPGRKTVLWIASGAPFAGFERPDTFLLPDYSQPKPGIIANRTGTVKEFAAPPIEAFQGDPHKGCPDLRNNDLMILRPIFERVLKQLADSAVAVYPVDARGIVVGFPEADQLVNGQEMVKGNADLGGNQAAWDFGIVKPSLEHFAETTGASPCFHNNYFSDCMHDAVADSESYYMLGYYRDKSRNKPGWRQLKVRVNQPDVQVMARSGYLYSTEPQNTKEAQVRDVSLALISPIDFPGLPFSVSVTPLPGDDPNQRTLQLRVFVPPTSLHDDPSNKHQMSVEVVAVASQSQGETIDKFAKTLEGDFKPQEPRSVLNTGLSYSDALHVSAGEITLRCVVRDNLDGRIGSVVIPYTVE